MGDIMKDNSSFQHLVKLAEIVTQTNPAAVDFDLSSGYLRQANRNGLHVVGEGDSIIFWTPSSCGSNIVVTTHFGPNKYALINRLAESLPLQQDITVKNVRQKELERFAEIGFREYNETEGWSEFSRFDDNSFPEQILDANNVELAGTEFRDFRWRLNRALRDYAIAAIEYDQSVHKNIFDKILGVWGSNLAERKGVPVSEVIRSTALFGVPSPDLFQYLFLDENGDPIGFVCLSAISKSTLALNAILNDFNYRKSYHVVTWETLKLTKRLGYRFLNLQGSEDENQHRSKRKFKAKIEVQKTHLLLKRA